MRHYCKSLVADIDDADLAKQPFEGANHPAWILGHVTVTLDGVSKVLGRGATAPESWGTLFGRASTLTTDRSDYPTKDELLAALDAALSAASSAAGEATAEQVAGPHSIDMLKRGLPTKGDLIAMLLTTHFAQHLGQLSAWRRAMGGAPLF